MIIIHEKLPQTAKLIYQDNQPIRGRHSTVAAHWTGLQVRSGNQSCIRGMFRTKIHLIRKGYPRPRIVAWNTTHSATHSSFLHLFIHLLTLPITMFLSSELQTQTKLWGMKQPSLNTGDWWHVSPEAKAVKYSGKFQGWHVCTINSRGS